MRVKYAGKVCGVKYVLEFIRLDNKKSILIILNKNEYSNDKVLKNGMLPLKLLS
jgi:hypothetical protein